MALCVIAMLMVVIFWQYQFSQDLKWQVRHYRRELKSKTKFAEQLIDHLAESDRMLMGIKHKPRHRFDNDDWPDVIDD